MTEPEAFSEVEYEPAINFGQIPLVFIHAIPQGVPLVVALKALKHTALTPATLRDLDMLADVIVYCQRGMLAEAQASLTKYWDYTET